MKFLVLIAAAIIVPLFTQAAVAQSPQQQPQADQHQNMRSEAARWGAGSDAGSQGSVQENPPPGPVIQAPADGGQAPPVLLGVPAQQQRAGEPRVMEHPAPAQQPQPPRALDQHPPGQPPSPPRR